MKILHVIESLGRGGAEQLLVTLLPELARQGARPALAVRGGAMDLRPELEARGVPLHILPRRHRWNLPGTARDIAALARREGAAVVHAHLYFPAVCTALARLLHLTDARTCVTFHNLAYAGANRRSLALTFRSRLGGLLYPRGIDRCLAVSNAVAAHYGAALGLSGIGVIPNPVDVERLAALASEPEAIDDTGVARPVRLLVPGRLVPEKGHLDLIEALALLRQQGVALPLRVAGDGPLRSTLEARVVASGLVGQVAFLGALPHEAMLAEMRAADVVVVPSRFEGFGLTAAEAMALGRAVVASSAGGLPDLVGAAALVVPPGDPGSLAAALMRAAGDAKFRAQLGVAAQHRIGQLASLPAIAAAHLAVYRELLAASEGKL